MTRTESSFQNSISVIVWSTDCQEATAGHFAHGITWDFCLHLFQVQNIFYIFFAKAPMLNFMHRYIRYITEQRGQIWGKRYTHMVTEMTATNSLTQPIGQMSYTIRSDLSFLCGLWNLDQELFLFRVGGILCKLSQNMCAWRSLNVHIVRQRCAIRTRARKRMLLACLLCKGKPNTIIR